MRKIQSGVVSIFLGSGLYVTNVMAGQLDVQVKGPGGEPIEGVVVFAEPLEAEAVSSAVTEPLVIAQKDKAFAPYIGVVQRNNPVRFENHDDITHHIYSVSGANRFSFKIAAGQSEQVIVSAGNPGTAEEVAMGCNIHDWMSGYMLILDTPWFASTDSQGKVALAIENSGLYNVSVWHPQLQTPDHRMRQQIRFNGKLALEMNLKDPLASMPEQVGDDDFEFLDDY